MGRRQGPSEERRAAIIQAAEDVFTEQGYHGASIREIARRADVSSALLYWFFPSKAKLFSGMLLARIDALGVLELPPDVLDVPPDILLPRLVRGFVTAIAQETQVRIIKLVLRESDRESELVNTLGQAVMGRVLGPLSTYLAHQMEVGRVRPANPDFVAQAMMGMIIAMVLRREILQEPESRTWDLVAYADTAVSMFLGGALLPPGAEPAPPVAHRVEAPRARQAARIVVEIEE